MNYTTVLKCRSCGSERLRDVISLGNQKIVEFTSKPVEVPLDLVRCEDCTLVQLRHTTNPSLLWNEGYGYKSGVNDAMVRHLHQIAGEAESYCDVWDTVLDIGCNDGTLLNGYTKGVLRVGIDPSGNVAQYAPELLKGKNHKIIISFFNKKAVEDYKFKVITAISMFYDLDDPNTFMDDIDSCLLKDGVFIIQQNYLGSMIKNCALDNICHEHLEYYSLTSLSKLLDRHGFEVYRVEENDLNGGSIRTFICRKGEREIESSVKEMLTAEIGLDFDGFANHVKRVTSELKELITKLHDEGKTIYAYGASTRGGTLLQACGIDNKLIMFAVERNPDKWGKIMESTGIPIISEEQFRKDKPDYAVILPWFFADQFIKREYEYLEEGGQFIIPLPKLRIV